MHRHLKGNKNHILYQATNGTYLVNWLKTWNQIQITFLRPVSSLSWSGYNTKLKELFYLIMQQLWKVQNCNDKKGKLVKVCNKNWTWSLIAQVVRKIKIKDESFPKFQKSCTNLSLKNEKVYVKLLFLGDSLVILANYVQKYQFHKWVWVWLLCLLWLLFVTNRINSYKPLW